MRTLRSLTIFLLALVVFIVVAALCVIVVYQFALLVDKYNMFKLAYGIAGGLVLGIIGGHFVSTRFAKYFAAKIWPSEKPP